MSEAPVKRRHIDYVDVQDTGYRREVAVMKRWADGSISYIDTALLDQIDRGRLKSIISSVHADKYELWELMSMTTLNNGLIALDYFHQLTKIKRAKGSVNINGSGVSVMDARPVDNKMIGAEFTDPTKFTTDSGPQPI